MCVDDQYCFIFSSIWPPTRLTFQDKNPQAATFVLESTAKCGYMHIQATGQPLFLDLTKGVFALDHCDRLLKDLAKCRAPVSAKQYHDYSNFITAHSIGAAFPGS
jgi:hypothetical protein